MTACEHVVTKQGQCLIEEIRCLLGLVIKTMSSKYGSGVREGIALYPDRERWPGTHCLRMHVINHTKHVFTEGGVYIRRHTQHMI